MRVMIQKLLADRFRLTFHREKIELPVYAGRRSLEKRNRAILAILLGGGLRRRELAELTLESIQRREGRWAIVDLVGKDRHIRTVPVPTWVKETLDAWLARAGIESGPLFRGVCRTDKLWGRGISEKTV